MQQWAGCIKCLAQFVFYILCRYSPEVFYEYLASAAALSMCTESCQAQYLPDCTKSKCRSSEVGGHPHCAFEGTELMACRWHINFEALNFCSQGHFQIILNPVRTPLFQWKLRLFDRLMYCSGCWSYTVGAVTTPVFIAIPVLTIWIGALRDTLNSKQVSRHFLREQGVQMYRMQRGKHNDARVQLLCQSHWAESNWGVQVCSRW